MGFFSSRIELNNTIKSLELEVEKLKSETSNKSEQITELNKKISALSQKNTEYEKKYINTNLECDFCYTTIQKDFSFCPKCGRKIEISIQAAPTQGNPDIFQTEDDGGYALITQYNGFDDTRIVIPSSINGKSVIGIWNKVFDNCTNLEEVIFEEGCKYIANNVFAGCVKLKKVKLPKSLLEIGNQAFANTGIEEIAIPPSVKVIGNYAFSGCRNLKTILLPPDLCCISYGMLSDTPLTEIKIPDNVRHICSYGLARTNIRKLELPNNLYSIDYHAFDTPTLQEIVMHANVEIINKDAFGKAWPTIYCGAGTKGLLFARKHGMKCQEIQTNKTHTPSICANGINMKLGFFQSQFGIRTNLWYKHMGINKAATWSWNTGRSDWENKLDIEKVMTMDEAYKLQYAIQNYAERNRNWCHIQSIVINQYWGSSDV